MIDALLLAVRDAVWNAGYGYSAPTCDILDDGQPPPNMGNIFVAIHEEASRSTNDNCLMEYFGFGVTLTMRVSVPINVVGTKLLTSKLARKAGPGGQPSFNARCEQLRAFLHMNWGILGDANTNMVNMEPDAVTVYGFAEPARYRGMEKPVLVGGDWFGAAPDAQDVGLKSTLSFRDCRRLQPIATYV